MDIVGGVRVNVVMATDMPRQQLRKQQMDLNSKQIIQTPFLVFFAREQIGAPGRGTLGDVVRLFFELKMYVFVI